MPLEHHSWRGDLFTITGVRREKGLGVSHTRAEEVFLRPVAYILPLESRWDGVDSESWEVVAFDGVDSMIVLRCLVEIVELIVELRLRVDCDVMR